MKKLISIPIYLGIMYFLPLIGEFELLTTTRLVIPLLGALLVLLTQPAIDPEEAKNQRGTDRWTFWLILGAVAIGQIAAVLEWRFLQTTNSVMWYGLVFLIVGILFRIWAIYTLGKFFTGTVRVQEDQKIIKSGPYAIVRHPSYLGAYLAVLGSTLWLCAWGGTVIAGGVLAYAYYRRIKAEEETLALAFGKEYSTYQLDSWRLIPGLW